MSIYCSGPEHRAIHYEGSHVRPWARPKVRVEWDISTIPPWIGREDVDEYDAERVCPFMRLSFYGPEDTYHAVVLSERQARVMAEKLMDWVKTPKVSVPRPAPHTEGDS